MNEIIKLLNQIKNHPNANFNVAACHHNDPTIEILAQQVLDLLCNISHNEVVSNIPKPIKVWVFDQAPKNLQNISTNGGDEDWVVLVPASFAKETTWISWIEGTDSCNEPKKYDLENGDIVYIGSHA